MISENDHALALEITKKALKEGVGGSMEYTYITKDGKEGYAEISLAPVFDECGKPSAFMGVYDIEEEEKIAWTKFYPKLYLKISRSVDAVIERLKKE